MANRYSKLPRRTYVLPIRLTEAEHLTAVWLARRLAIGGKDRPLSDILRLSLTPQVVALLLEDKV